MVVDHGLISGIYLQEILMPLEIQLFISIWDINISILALLMLLTPTQISTITLVIELKWVNGITLPKLLMMEIKPLFLEIDKEKSLKINLMTSNKVLLMMN